jgi:putative ABC transport system ATP-binding protein
MDALIEARGLVKHYVAGSVTAALRGVSLTVQPGEFVAIMGPSGCGKSTLLHMLGGLDRPTEGEVHLRGQRIDNLNEAKRAVLRRNDIGFVFQFFNLIGNFTVADNVDMPALLTGLSKHETAQRRATLLKELGIADKADKIPAQLSGGERQRVALARALINRPAVLLADEPTGNLDTANTRDVLALLTRYHAAGQTIVMVTHDPDVAGIADRIVTMRDGQIVDDRAVPRSPVEQAERLMKMKAR